MQPAFHDHRPSGEVPVVGQLQVSPRDGLVQRASDALGALLGCEADELVGRPWVALIHPDDHTHAQAIFARLAAGGPAEAAELRLLRADGAPHWVLVTALAVGAEPGPSSGHVILVHDLAARKRAEQNAAFLAALGEALIPVVDVPTAIALTTRRVAAYLAVAGCFVDEVDEAADRMVIHGGGAGVAPVELTLRLGRMPAGLREAVLAGQAVTVEDTAADPRTSDQHASLFAPAAIGTLAAVPGMRAGRWAAALLVYDPRPRRWHPEEIALLRAVAALAWLAIDRLRSVTALAGSSERLTLALTATDGFIYEYDPTTRAVNRSPGLRQVTGFAVDEVPPSGEWWNARVHPEDYQRAVTDGIAAFHTGFSGYSLEYRVLHRDGHYVDVWDRAIVQRDEAGRAVRVFGHAIDVSERKRAERLLQERIAEFETLMETVPVPIWVAHDPICQRITGNSAGYRLLRQRRGSNLSRTAPSEERPANFRVFSAGVELDGNQLPMQRAAQTGAAVEDVELDLVFDDGAVTTVYGYAAPLFDAEGKVRGCIGVYIDVTERRRSDEERARLFAAERQAREAAQAAVRVRDSFLSIAAHELKTPLTVMLGNAQLLQRRTENEPTYSERDRRAIKAVAAQTARLERMIATLLDISRIEAGQLRITRAPFDLGALALRLVQEVRPTLRAHSIVYLGDGPVPVNGDELRVEQVLQNLISNAVKYSPSGGPVTLRAWVAGAQARVSVSDEGIGIPADDLPNLFSRFFRATNVGEHQISGIGIGLYVVKEIITLHGGEVEVASRPGAGTTVTITLPLLGAA